MATQIMVTADKVIKVFGRPIGSKLLGTEKYMDMIWIWI